MRNLVTLLFVLGACVSGDDDGGASGGRDGGLPDATLADGGDGGDGGSRVDAGSLACTGSCRAGETCSIAPPPGSDAPEIPCACGADGTFCCADDECYFDPGEGRTVDTCGACVEGEYCLVSSETGGPAPGSTTTTTTCEPVPPACASGAATCDCVRTCTRDVGEETVCRESGQGLECDRFLP